jgi:outer membrane lipoprotein SlyB
MRPSFSLGAGRILVLSLSLALSGCSKWQLESPSPASLTSSTRDRTIRVERQDGTVVELVQVKVEEDTLTGLIPGSALPGAPLRRVTVPMMDVRRVATKRGDIKRILGAMAAVPLAYFGGSYLMQW